MKRRRDVSLYTTFEQLCRFIADWSFEIFRYILVVSFIFRGNRNTTDFLYVTDKLDHIMLCIQYTTPNQGVKLIQTLEDVNNPSI